MYLKRTIEKDIEKWIENDGKKPLVILGTRQCGKSTTIKTVATKHYKKVYYISFMEEYKKESFKAFKKVPKFDVLMKYLENLYNEVITLDQDTLIIIDEFQECLEFYTELKYINERLNFKNIVCLGSFLTMKVFSSGVSVPVGQIDTLRMYTLSFEEFLMNINEFVYKKYIECYQNRNIDEVSHQEFLKYFKMYQIIGGFPEAIKEFMNNNESYVAARKINASILDKYESDVTRYLDKKELVKAKSILKNSILFMGKEKNTFTLSTIKTDARYRDYEYVLLLLVKSFICYKVDNCQNLIFPLRPRDVSSKFKIYLCDMGLVSACYLIDQFNIDLEQFNNIKGNMMEGYIISEFYRNDLEPYYHSFNIGSNTYELDCVYQDEELIPKVVEIKSGINKSSKSLNKVKENKHIKVRLASFDSKFDDFNIPVYMFGYMLSHRQR